MKWKTLSSSYLHRDTWLKARVDSCQRGDGKVIEPYYVMEYPNWVAGLGLTKAGDVILISQYRHALGEVCLELPGGCIDKTDDSPEAAMRREFREETGYVFEKATYLGQTSANPSTNSNIMHMFLLEGGEHVQQQELDANEEIHVEVVSFNEFLQNLSNNRFVQSMHMAVIFFALKQLGKLMLNP